MTNKFVKEKKVKDAWKDIEKIVEGLSLKKDKTRPECWEAVRELVSKRSEIRLNKGIEEQIFSMIDKRISDEKDNLYYEQTRSFTNNFSFLRESTELQRAVGKARAAKFTDKESYSRFCELRTLFHDARTVSEAEQIESLLEREDISYADKRILGARLGVIRENEAKKELEGK